MFLKTLQIKGFKSFAESAELPLEPGVTVVVGPNGSGKSNVVDAIGWVLGAQAPSAVRSQKMDDVIFAGTAKRPALGRAEVSLTIDNSAGMLPIEFTEVTLSRLLFRSGDSEYAINGVPCRLLDIQELLSDSGVGRQQHVIISQGNIDAVLNARPEERRLIIEEAAGVLKYRRRKERAERRLSATEANLTRIQDLLREVRRQLRPLERQADAARRHGSLVEELTTLRMHLAGREVVRLRGQLERSDAEHSELRTADHRVRAALADLDARIVATEASLSALGHRDVGDSLVRYERLREKGRGQMALLAERERSVQRELSRSVDAAVIASLESERAQLAAEAEQIAADIFEIAAEQGPLAADVERLAAERADFESRWADGVAAPSGEASEVRGELAAVRASIERTTNDRNRLVIRRDNLAERVQRLTDEAGVAAESAARAEAAVPEHHERVTTSVTVRSQAEAELESAEAEATDAETEHSAWVARAEALALALDEARHRAGAERLADTDGVLGTLLDLVEVDAGWEEAFEAAAGVALGAVVVADPAAGRRALEALAADDHRGAVLALGSASVQRPSVVDDRGSVRAHVRPRPGSNATAEPRAFTAIAGLLDRLLAGVVVVDGTWTDALDHALAHPDSVVVTRRGDRFSTTGWRLRATGSGATGAALDEAVARAEQSGARRGAARARVEHARTAIGAARRDEQEAARRRDTNDAARRTHAETVDRLAGDIDEARAELESLAAHIVDLVARLEREAGRVAELEGRLPGLDAAEIEVTEAARQMAEARTSLEEHTARVAARRADLDVRAAAVEERERYVSARRAQVEERLVRNQDEARDHARRRVELEALLRATQRLTTVTSSRLTVIDANLETLREDRRRQSDEARQVTERLEGLRRQRSTAEAELEEVRARSQKAEIAEAETRMRLDAATEALRHDLDSEPDAAIATECPPLPEGVSASARVRELERELKIMGPINPLALIEFEELSERHTFLESQLEDIRSTRRELGKVIRAIDDEIVKVFAAAYADVSENFVQLFETLFPGGQGRLRLTEPDNLLETGIEIEAKPSGKNVRKLSLLSGGERSLTALAYLFAVFRSRPSPFYVMDEVEAALDDVNLHRFLDLVNEFRATAQLIIVSHQKRTMEAADVLFGVTMEPGGSSRVVSERAATVLD